MDPTRANVADAVAEWIHEAERLGRAVPQPSNERLRA